MFDKEWSIDVKNEIQQKAVDGSKSYRRLLLSWATGCGKSLGALKILKNDYDLNPNIKGYLICKESNHIDNWLDEIKTHRMKYILDCSEQFLYASLHKYSDRGIVDFIILDEVHALTPKRIKELIPMIGPHTRLIMLSATIDGENRYYVKQLAVGYGEYNITITEAIEMRILPHPTVYVHKYKLDDVVGKFTLTIKKDFVTHLKYNLTEKGAYDLLSKEIEKYRILYEENGKDWARNLWVNTGSQRKRLMAEFKTKRAKKLIKNNFRKQRYIVFTGSKEQAELIGRNYVHSGKKKKENLKIKNKFNRGRLTSLVVVNMFREGMNLRNIHKGLIIQLGSVKLSFIQMLGRVFRSNIPEMHIMVFKDTQDEKYLKRVMEGFNQGYVKTINYE